MPPRLFYICSQIRSYATQTNPPYRLTKPSNLRKSYVFNRYVNLLLQSKVQLIIQHNNLTAREHLNFRKSLSLINAKATVVRAGILDVAYGVTHLIRKENWKGEYGDLLLGERAKRVQLPIQSILLGPICLVTLSDFVPSSIKAIIKTLAFSKGKLMLIGGVIEHQTFDSFELDEMKNLPDLESLRGQLLGLLSSSGQQLAHILGSTQQMLCYALETHKMNLEGLNKKTECST
ncbi:54S ribosomal protein L11, mitochondrial [Neolecta irregularis DAH-3]|uniref:54S ribosomal protein L11, mitochondrial n=1 Tax=Neolecta irregularis (strain DAH-3) TaxID=1198029 RepID=A0A1U7LW42_NEOID|nr:54S ribosomal protein L11, mitochondrial [Neolecta irregularis DAH-3]|eukprot:OLL26887.1 54S ribosomal protein L11, mitochondrial [Neolecta irregularis DAH-3]